MILKKYLLVSAMPTPNGPLHIGHLSAQFLPQDIFKRFKKDRGYIVEFYSGFDVFDNAISLAAQKNKTTTSDMAIYFQNTIKNELTYFDIDIDLFINYLDPENIKKTVFKVNSLTEKLSPFIVKKNIPYPYYNNDTPLSGNWYSGRCNKCNNITKGYSCDVCGISITPADIHDIRFNNSFESNKINWKDEEISFLNVPFCDLTSYISNQAISEEIKAHCYSLNAESKTLFQWTGIDEWGFRFTETSNEVFFNRNFSLIEQMFISDDFHTKHGIYPFDENSDVTTIIAYGKDNVGLLLIDLPRILFGTQIFKPYSKHWISHFYCIDDKKMSTSKNYALWLNDIIESKIDSDSVRLYICSVYSDCKNINMDLPSLKKQELFLSELKTGIIHLNKLGEFDSNEIVLFDSIKLIAAMVEELFESDTIDLKQYHNLFKRFCSLIYDIKCKKNSFFWINTLNSSFGALVPKISRFAIDNVNVYDQ